MRNRYYDSGVGRFITRDPIGIAGGINLYAYVGNDPVNWVDPWGLEPQGQPSQQKQDLPNLMNVWGMDLKKDESGVWSQTWDKAETVEFGAGLALKVDAGTTIQVNYLSGDLYHLQVSSPVTIYWGIEFNSATFTYADIEFSYGTNHFTVKESDMKGPLWDILSGNPSWDV